MIMILCMSAIGLFVKGQSADSLYIDEHSFLSLSYTSKNTMGIDLTFVGKKRTLVMLKTDFLYQMINWVIVNQIIIMIKE